MLRAQIRNTIFHTLLDCLCSLLSNAFGFLFSVFGPIAASLCIKITVILLSAIYYPQPCGAVFIVKILSHIATAAPIHLMSGFKEQLKALLQQLWVFDVGELDIPPDLEHSPRINTVVWRLTCRALYSLNTEIHTASMKVPLSLFSPPHPSFIHCFFLFFFFLPLADLGTLCSAAACTLSPSIFPSSSLSLVLFLCPSLLAKVHLNRGAVPSLTCACQC